MVGACLYYLFAFASVLGEVQFFIVYESIPASYLISRA